MKKYNIWCEGFAVTGNWGKAQYIATIKAASFKQACDLLFKDNKAMQEIWGNYNSKIPSVWGCKLYDNEKDARKSFG